MNIIKLKDVVMPSEHKISNFFNDNLKGKYAYWVQMRYIFPLNSLDSKTYIQYEQTSDIQMAGYTTLPHIDMYDESVVALNFSNNYVDIDATEKANSVYNFELSNNYVTNSDITIDKLKIFRRWLAEQLLLHNIPYTDEQRHMLEYYKNDMYNDVVKTLYVFGNSVKPTALSTASCTTCGSVVNNIKMVDSCNVLDVYKNNVHALMNKTFSDIEFWKACNKEFLQLFKKYIDNIILTKLMITTATSTSPYCVCICSNENAEINFVKAMENLSKALQYIIEDKVNGHNNFIYDAFDNWSNNLYEKMYWK